MSQSSAGFLKDTFSKISFVCRGKPRCFKDPRQNIVMDRGLVCFSVDFEMAWAWCRDPGRSANAVQIGLRERDNVPQILNLFETYGIAATWAVVGHLLLESCPKEKGNKHPDMPRPAFFSNELWDFHSGDWYDFDPTADFKTAPAWYAPDLIRLILKSGVKHEIACHSFSHIGFNEKYCSRELADAELKKCSVAMAKFGIKPASMVFPGNEAGHFDLLVKHGYSSIRYFPHPRVEISLPVKLNGLLWAIPESANIVPDDDWSSEYILWRLKKYVNKSIAEKSLCNFWFHPSISAERIKHVLFPILEYCAQKRNNKNLDCVTMKNIADLMGQKCAE